MENHKKTTEMKVIKLILTLFLGFSLGLQAQDIPKPMAPPRLVNDFAQIFTPNEASRLEQKLRNYHDTTTTQIYVVTVTDLMGYDISDFTFRLGEEWGVGQKGKDNGAIILIKPRVENQRGEVMIATGYGLEDVIPDALASRIVNQEMIPYFRDNRYYRGVDGAIDVMIGLASGKFTADQYKAQGVPAGAFLIILLLVLFFVILFNVNKTKQSSIGHDIPLWIALGMLSGGRRRGGGFGSFSSGSGGFGGFSGGGGGSFGGGGARGSW